MNLEYKHTAHRSWRLQSKGRKGYSQSLFSFIGTTRLVFYQMTILQQHFSTVYGISKPNIEVQSQVYQISAYMTVFSYMIRSYFLFDFTLKRCVRCSFMSWCIVTFSCAVSTTGALNAAAIQISYERMGFSLKWIWMCLFHQRTWDEKNVFHFSKRILVV